VGGNYDRERLAFGDVEYQPMPFHRYSSYFEPQELSKLAAAYEAAWQELLPETSSLTPDAIFLLKKKLAQIILASACTGKRDVDQLKQIAVRGMSGRIPTPDSPEHLAQQGPTAWRHALAHRFHRRVSQGAGLRPHPSRRAEAAL